MQKDRKKYVKKTTPEASMIDLIYCMKAVVEHWYGITNVHSNTLTVLVSIVQVKSADCILNGQHGWAFYHCSIGC